MSTAVVLCRINTRIFPSFYKSVYNANCLKGPTSPITARSVNLRFAGSNIKSDIVCTMYWII